MGYWSGACGLSPFEIDFLELREIFAIFKAHEQKELNEWRRVRMLGYWTFKAMGAKKLKRPNQLLKLKGDEIHKPKRISREALKAYLEKWNDKTVLN